MAVDGDGWELVVEEAGLALLLLVLVALVLLVILELLLVLSKSASFLLLVVLESLLLFPPLSFMSGLEFNSMATFLSAIGVVHIRIGTNIYHIFDKYIAPLEISQREVGSVEFQEDRFDTIKLPINPARLCMQILGDS